MIAPILTDVEMTIASCGYSKPYQNREVFEAGFMTGARFTLAAAEKRMARDTEIRAQLAERIYALLDDYGGAMTRTEKAYYEAALAAAKGES